MTTPCSTAADKSKFNKLNKLLDQTSMYSQFLADKIPSQHKDFTAENESGRPAKKQKKGKEDEVDDHNINSLLAAGKLRSYQIHGVDWLISLFNNGLNGILADEMGLGKTLQLISFMAYLRSKEVYGPFIVAAPLSTLHGWVAEVKKWVPGFPVQLYHGSKEERAQMRNGWSSPGDKTFPLIITSYEICINDRNILSRIGWKVLAVDEGHRLKNMECKLIKTLKEYNSENRLLLTGTPLQNNLRELWSLLNFLLPDIFDSLEKFESWFNFDENCILETEVQMNIVQQERDNQIISKLHEILRPFVLRRIKSDVLKGVLPDKREFVVYCPLTPQQKKYYQVVLHGEAKEFFGKTHSGTGLKNMLMQLRKVCNHPYLLREPEDETGQLSTDDRIIHWCGKMKLLDVMLTRLKARGHKVLIFSQMTSFLNILEDYLIYRGHSYCRIDGAVEAKDRQAQILHFNKTKECFCFLLSTRAGGLGINLTSADTVIIYDSDWNPHQDDQAQDRCHRLGQTKAVHVYRFITPSSVEVDMLKRANSKRKLDQLVIAKGQFGGKAAGKGAKPNTMASITKELEDLFNMGEKEEKQLQKQSDSAKLFNPYDEKGILKDATIELLLDRETSTPYEDGLDRGFQVVKHNTTFSDLF